MNTNETIQQVLEDYFDGRQSRYDVNVIEVKSDMSRIHFQLTFISQERYCCAEPGCHFSMDRFLEFADDLGVKLPSDCRVVMDGFVQDGAVLDSLASFGKSTSSEAYDFRKYFSIRFDAKR